MTDQIHSCSYYCHIPACIKAQRDELRDKFVANSDTHRMVSIDTLKYLLSILDDNMTYTASSEINAIINNRVTESQAAQYLQTVEKGLIVDERV